MHLLAPYLLDFLAIAYALTWCLPRRSAFDHDKLESLLHNKSN